MRIAFLPVDGRPVTRDAFLALAEAAGVEVLTPPRALLGWLKEPADVEALWAWVAGPATSADLLIASAELVIYGGLVPSRVVSLPLARCLARADRWIRAREQAPRRRLWLVASNLRLPGTADATEEPDYWAVYGPQIFALSYHEDRFRETGDPDSAAAAEAARRAVPPAVLADVRARRARNLAVLLHLVELSARGIVDFLLIGQDDTAEWGWTRQDLGAIQEAIDRCGVRDRVWVTYGTDELAVRLLGRALLLERGQRPAVQVVYSFPDNREAVPRYEGQPLDRTVTSHLLTAGCRRVTDDPDMVLFVHNFPGAQEEAPHQVPSDPRELDGFLAALEEAGRRGLPCALADVRYSNGSDRTLVDRLLAAPGAYGIRAYGGWNTMSNTLGMVLTHALLPPGPRTRAFTILRFLDDWGYQAIVRQRLAHEVLPRYPGASPQDLGPAYEACAVAARRWLQDECVPPLERCFGCRIGLARVGFPWRRLFNIELHLEVSEVSGLE